MDRTNASGLASIGYRAGTYHTFRDRLLARLSAPDFPALNPLTTRRANDFTLATLDAFAMLADVLTFYQERIANESYLRTAVERRSVLHLARLIGYQLAPGVAATTAIAFTLESAPGDPAQAARPVTIPVGTRVQSVPDPGQDAQTFETAAAVTGRVEWNEMRVQHSVSVPVVSGLTELHLQGTDTQLQTGDVIALIARNRQRGRALLWATVTIDTATVDLARGATRIVWSTPLGNAWKSAVDPRDVRVVAMRHRAALFGHNAPDPNLLHLTSNVLVTQEGDEPKEWVGFNIPAGQTHIDLEAVYPRIAAGSVVVLSSAAEDLTQMYVAASNDPVSRADFGLSARVSRLELEFEGGRRRRNGLALDRFPLRETQVLAGDLELPMTDRPLPYPLYGDVVTLDSRQDDLAPKQLIAIGGKRQRVLTSTGEHILRRPPELLVNGRYEPIAPEKLDPVHGLEGQLRWHLDTPEGTAHVVEAPAGAVRLVRASKLDETISEVATIDRVMLTSDGGATRTTLVLTEPVRYCYERASATVNANVTPATHGETIAEIAGSGDSSKANQTFRLRQAPLTYVSTGGDPTGRVSTLEVRVNGVLWRETPSLFGCQPLDHVYTLRQDDDGGSTIQFGDGINGARLPRGANNVRLRYRRGLGTAGNLRRGQLSMLLTRPLGVKSAVNPEPSSGGQDPELLADARRNSPLPVLTLGRAVSARDYADYGRAFPGIAKASGEWIDDGRRRGIFLTVAGPDGAPVPPGSATARHLLEALRRVADPLVPVSIVSYLAAPFELNALVRVDNDVAPPERVLAAVIDTLGRVYSFERRDFAQPVTLGEVYAVIQRVPGVLAADIRRLRRRDASPGVPEMQDTLTAQPLRIADDGLAIGAELLTIDPTALEIAVVLR